MRWRPDEGTTAAVVVAAGHPPAGTPMKRALVRVATWWFVGCAEVAVWALHAWTPEDDPGDRS